MILLALSACTGTDDLGPPSSTTDVLVIGSGAAGLSAAWEAADRGRDVVVLERESRTGGSSWYAGRFWAAGTRFQAEAGVTDDVALALEQWEVTTDGGAADDPAVIRFVEDSATTLAWLVDDVGARVDTVEIDIGYPGPARIHTIAGSLDGPIQLLTEALGERVVTDTEPTGLVRDGRGRVIGASWHDLGTDTSGWIEAGATIVATGGFGRNLEKVLADRPELDGMRVLVEIAPSSDGGGIPLLEDVGAWQNPGRSGLYVHSVPDPRPENPGEVLWPGGLESTLMIDGDGQRIANELEFNTFRLVDRVVATEAKRIFALYPDMDWGRMIAAVPAYTSTGIVPWNAGDLETAGIAVRHPTPGDVAAALGLAPANLQATVARYDQLAHAGFDEDFGKDRAFLHPFGASPIVVMELFPGSAKSFVGFAVDVDGRIVDPAGEVVPGVYAAGEVTGMLGTPAIGRGLSGAITACYSTGRAAGATADADLGD